MRLSLVAWSLLGLLLARPAVAQSGNLLRNGRFQDDWLTLLPENKNHHWCYSSEFYNRRDYNPDTWYCKGSWQWLDADLPYGQRRLVLRGPAAEVAQRVNWVAVHDDRARGGFPDAGGFPALKLQRSRQPLRVVRDLTFRVHLQGKDVPADAGGIEVGLCPPGDVGSDPMGTVVPPTALASTPLPAGTYAARVVEVKLPAATWLQAIQAAAAKNPAEAAETAKSGTALPGTVSVAVRYKGPAGQVELEQTEVLEAGPQSPNLLPHGGFEVADKSGYPNGWEPPVKYRHFPPGHYYIFNTWHNSRFDNRGPVTGDTLVLLGGRRSLKMIVPAGDEKAVASSLVVLNQKEARLLEVSARVKTDRLCTLQIDAVDDKGRRLDGFSFIHKAPASIGTDDWRLVRQVFRPREPAQAVRLLLCARGVNGYTLDDTGLQPQASVVGTVWWDDVRLCEPESTGAELTARGVKAVEEVPVKPGLHLEDLDLGERMFGANTLGATVVNPGAAGTFTLRWDFTSPSGKKSRCESKPQLVPANGRAPVQVPYELTEPCTRAYTEYRGELTLLDGKGETAGHTELWFATWPTPIDLELGALYLRPDQKQFVRMNLGLSWAALQKLAEVRVEVLRRRDGQVVAKTTVPATPQAVAAQRGKIPLGLREDFTNLLLADLDVSALPVQPFNDPQRNWLVRATAVGTDGKAVATAESQPFCRQGHDAPQPPVQSVKIKDNLLYVNDRPWMPWGAVYGHVPVYAGPADPGPGQYRDLHNLPAWSIYDRFGAEHYNRRHSDLNCMRYVAGSVTDPKVLEKHWKEDNLYGSSAYVVPQPAFSLAELATLAGGKPKLDAYLAFCKTAPMVVSVAPGIEEAFGLFHGAAPGQLQGMGQVVDALRQATGKPVMVGHGGYWNRLEFEKVPYFDIYDPETEPLYPANLHTDLWPLVKGKDKVIWLRPQMYESVPYERWRFHVYVELMRGCRGWQVAHGPGDPALFRGLHGELKHLEPAVYSADPGPKVSIEPWVEHWSRRHGGRVTVIAATTHGMTLGRWRAGEAEEGPAGRGRVTESGDEVRTEANAYGIGQEPERGPSIHGIQYLPDARAWPAGSKLVQWVRLDAKAAPLNLVLLAKADGRWTHAASWGKFDVAKLRSDPKLAHWFLHGFYRHAYGLLGWDTKLLDKALPYVPDRAADMGALPAAGEWVKLEVPLEKIAAAGALLDGVGFLHEGGRVAWGRTAIISPKGEETVVWGDSLALPPGRLAKTRVSVAGLKAGTKVRVLFEDRELTAGDGHFIDDFRGEDLYQRYGGGPGVGYGDTPVALHVYEVPAP